LYSVKVKVSEENQGVKNKVYSASSG